MALYVGFVLRRLLVLVSAIVLVDVAFYSAITPLLPYYTDLLDLSKSEAGALAGAYAAGTLLLSLPAGLLDEHARHCVVEGHGGEPAEMTDELMAAVGRLMRRG